MKLVKSAVPDCTKQVCASFLAVRSLGLDIDSLREDSVSDVAVGLKITRSGHHFVRHLSLDSTYGSVIA